MAVSSLMQDDERSRWSPFVLGLALPAIVVVLARDAEGVSLVPLWLAALLQAPLIIVWSLSEAGWIAPRKRLEAGPIDGALAAFVAICAAVLSICLQSPAVFFAAMTFFVAGQILLEGLTRLYHRLDRLMLEPFGALTTITQPWAASILIGAILLSLPLATHSSVPDYRHNFWLHILNCVQLSTSAACLVGIGVYGFGDDLTLFGQIVVVLLTQLSGMAFAALGLAAVQPFLSRVIRLGSVWKTALILQIAGVALMWGSWTASDAPTLPQRLWWGVVHAGSALWNSGWTMRSDGLAAYFSNSLVFTVITVLSIAGSLGIPILLDLLKAPGGSAGPAARPVVRPAWQWLASWEAGGALVLLVLGAALLFFFETPRVMPATFVPTRPVDFGEGRVSIRDDMGARSRWSMSVFVSGTLRSTGLQSVPLSQGAISWPTYGLMLAWMIVGGSAAGVAGGMRLTTLLLMAMTLLVGRAWCSSPQGRAARSLILRATIRWFVFWIFLTMASIFALFAVTDGTWYEQVFESVAALNGVGLSTGLSLHLTWAGRLTMIGLMILGRLMPVAFWLGLSLKMTAVQRNTTTSTADRA